MQDTAPLRPFVHAREIVWGDTDAAGIAYTGRFPNFTLDAIDAWFAARLGTDWFRLHTEQGGGTPFVPVSMDFKRPLRPRDRLETEVLLRRLGRTSLEFGVTGRLAERAVSFTGRFVCVFVDKAGRPHSVPEVLRPALERELDPGGPQSGLQT
jgi:4-hydroxybenzoyl-CoA thioesterase